MKRPIRVLAAAGWLLAALPADVALAQKPGGILKMYDPDSPQSRRAVYRKSQAEPHQKPKRDLSVSWHGTAIGPRHGEGRRLYDIGVYRNGRPDETKALRSMKFDYPLNGKIGPAKVAPRH